MDCCSLSKEIIDVAEQYSEIIYIRAQSSLAKLEL